MRKILIVLAILSLLVGLMPCSSAYAAPSTYYVSKLGNDGNNGSFSTPWLTIDHAVDTISAGDTIYVRLGVYSEQVTIADLNGDGSYTTIQNYNGEAAIIDGTGLSVSGSLIDINNCSYMNITGLEIRDAVDCSGIVQVYGANASHMNFTNLYIHNCDDSGMNIGSYSLATASYFTVDSCTIYNTNVDLGHAEELQLLNIDYFEIMDCTVGKMNEADNIDLVGCSHGTVHHNDLEHLYIDAFGNDITDIDVYSNYFHDTVYQSGTHSFIGCEQEPASVTDINFYNNIYYNTYPSTDSGAFVVYGEAGGFTALTFSFVNNTLYAISGVGWTDIIFGDATGNYSNCVVANNILVMRGTTSVPISWHYWENGGVVVDNNLLYCRSGSLRSEYKEAEDWDMYGTNPILSNPLLVNPPSSFLLQGTSPAKDTGSATYAPSTDYAGTARPQDAGDDVGAYECIGTSFEGYFKSSKPRYTYDLDGLRSIVVYRWITISFESFSAGEVSGELSLATNSEAEPAITVDFTGVVGTSSVTRIYLVLVGDYVTGVVTGRVYHDKWGGIRSLKGWLNLTWDQNGGAGPVVYLSTLLSCGWSTD